MKDKEIKALYNDTLNWTLFLAIVVIAVLGFLIISTTNNLNDSLEDVAHIKCVNITGNYIYAPEEFRLLNRDEIVYQADCKFNYYLNNTICSQPFVREVCTIVDSKGNEIK